MPQVNLIAERRKRERRELNIARSLGYACGVLAMLGMIVFVLTRIQIAKLQSDIEDLDKQDRDIQPAVALVKQLQNEISDRQPLLDLVKLANRNTLHWYVIMQEIGQGLTAASWLDGLTINHDDKANADTLNLNGHSQNQDTVARTMQALQSMPIASQVILKTVELTPPAPAKPGEVPPPNPARFEMEVDLQPNDKQPVVEPPSGGVIPNFVVGGQVVAGQAVTGQPVTGQPGVAQPVTSAAPAAGAGGAPPVMSSPVSQPAVGGRAVSAAQPVGTAAPISAPPPRSPAGIALPAVQANAARLQSQGQ